MDLFREERQRPSEGIQLPGVIKPVRLIDRLVLLDLHLAIVQKDHSCLVFVRTTVIRG
jgi:hypothetical protein